MPVSTLLEQIINGLVVGSMYALIASGLTLIWGTMHLLNFAHGEFYMLGGYVLYFSLVVGGINPIFAVLLAVAGVGIVALLIELAIIRRLLAKADWESSSIVATLGISIFLQNVALRLWGERFKNIPYFLDGTIEAFGVRLAQQRLLIFAVAVAVMAALWFIIKRTPFGIGLRATAQDPDAATLYGIDAQRIFLATFGLSAILAAIAATMLAPIYSVNPWMGVPPLLKGFVVVVLGGLGSFEGAIIGGILLGVVESLGVSLLSSQWQEVVAFSVMILILWIRPSGLFGIKQAAA